MTNSLNTSSVFVIRHLSSVIQKLFVVLVAFCVFSSEALTEPLIRDAEIEHTLRLYADPIFIVAGLKPSAIHIFIVEDDTLNAYVAGGQNMFIHTGLIEATDSPDMLIGVMAHETGHIAGGHLAQGTEKLKNASLGTILTYVLGAAAAAASRNSGAAAAVITGGNSAITKNFLAFTRDHENAADQAALTFLDKLGISASGLLKMFQVLERNSRSHPASPDPYMLTHPLTPERIDHVRNHVQTSKIPEGQYPHQFDILHARMVAKLYGFLQSPEQTMSKYPQSDTTVPARMARAIAYYKMPDLDRSMKEMDSLIAENPSDPFFHELKGQILFENGRIKDAITSYQAAVKYLPDSPLILADLAKVELAQQPPLIQPAILHLETANRLDDSNSDAWRLLATAYGKTGNMGMSYLALAEEAALDDDPGAALKDINQAIPLLKDNSPARQRAQDLKLQAIEMKSAEKDDKS